MHAKARVLIQNLLFLAIAPLLNADVSVPAIFGDQMVLQQKQSNPIWGWADPGEKVTVSIDGQTHSAEADQEGNWKVELDAIPAGGPYRLEIKGNNTLSFADVLVGEVWICSGQSNMAWSVENSEGAELEILTANYPNIRLISVPRLGTQEAQDNFDGQWVACTPENIKDFSAVGYFFGRRLLHALDVPIGLVDNAWGGSAADAWIRRDVLESDSRFDELMAWWDEREADYDYDAELANWEEKVAKWEEEGSEGRKPRKPGNMMTGNQRPGNIFNGVLHPTIGYGLRGVIWYQGESNASRAYQYRDLFPLMIQHWRDEWRQGDFPFYYVQLADYRAELAEPAESDWAELREAQTMTMDRLKNVGQAVIIDIGEGRDIHPRNKQMVANRLARWALAKDYGKEIIYQGPAYKSMRKSGGKITLAFEHVGQGLYSFDTTKPQGFAIAGKDKTFVWANARIVGKNKVEVWSEAVEKPIAVRYAWADNPVCNLYSRDGLPATPFRTDDWPGVTIDRRHR